MARGAATRIPRRRVSAVSPRAVSPPDTSPRAISPRAARPRAVCPRVDRPRAVSPTDPPPSGFPAGGHPSPVTLPGRRGTGQAPEYEETAAPPNRMPSSPSQTSRTMTQQATPK
ncbi:hypothetical protein Psi01_56100 [Planobispora siamensis]|uniref:Uncharacterized protein n=1 Tax=Planobispora siamensis TaxID=936338 RepID=A0A8J3SKW0_9ACTN|nr:hypothetical protein Psi01_56100 [Planobispora siamensis]